MASGALSKDLRHLTSGMSFRFITCSNHKWPTAGLFLPGQGLTCQLRAASDDLDCYSVYGVAKLSVFIAVR